MAKRRGSVFTRAARDSGASGVVRVHTHSAELTRAMGQGKTLLFQGRVNSVVNNGRVTFKAYHNSSPLATPREDGITLTLTGTTAYTAPGVINFSVSTDMMANVEVAAEVDVTAGVLVGTVEFNLDVTIIEA